MKALYLILFVFASLLSSMAQTDVYAGMSIYKFAELKDYVDFDSYMLVNNVFSENDTIAGVNGKSSYEIKYDHLESVVFEANKNRIWSLHDFNLKNECDSFFVLFGKLEKSLIDKYGNPYSKNVSKPLFKGDESDHNTHSLALCTWHTVEFNVNLELSFSGNDTSENNYIINSEAKSYFYLLKLTYSRPEVKSVIQNKENFVFGMSIDALQKKAPGLFPNGIKREGNYSEKGTVFGLEGDWHYTFDEKTVKRLAFTAYSKEGELNKEGFARFLKSCSDWVSSVSAKYGNPETRVTENPKFIDPAESPHWGYEVDNAKWILKDKEINLRFEFFGGKGDYFFILEYVEEISE